MEMKLLRRDAGIVLEPVTAGEQLFMKRIVIRKGVYTCRTNFLITPEILNLF
jgi:hypothetical protein